MLPGTRGPTLPRRSFLGLWRPQHPRRRGPPLAPPRRWVGHRDAVSAPALLSFHPSQEGRAMSPSNSHLHRALWSTRRCAPLVALLAFGAAATALAQSVDPTA